MIWGCRCDVYLLIPPYTFQCGPPLDSTMSPTTQVHQNRNERDYTVFTLSYEGKESSRANE